MKIRNNLKISTKLNIGFSIISIVIFISYYALQIMLKDIQRNSDQLNKVTIPALSVVNSYAFIIGKPDKINFNEYRDIKEVALKELKKWELDDKKLMQEVIKKTDQLILYQEKLYYNKQNKNKKGSELTTAKKEQLKHQTEEILLDLTLLKEKNEVRIQYAIEVIETNILVAKTRIIIYATLIIILIVLISFITSKSMTNRIRYIHKNIKNLAKGQLPDQALEYSKDEIGEISSTINMIISALRQKTEFTQEIEKGNFNQDLFLEPEDLLGNALVEMRDSLKKAEIQKAEQEKASQERAWASQGIAKFNEIIREYSNKPDKFYAVIISELSKYLNAQLGGIYIINKDEINDEVRIELMGFYAFGREKFEQKICKPGENLVGQCYLEQKTIFITDVPKGYTKILSGLGQDDPSSLLIVPLKLNEEVYGVLEIGTLSLLEDYQVEFTERAGAIIASTISNINISRKNTLLLEESKEKSARLAKQEAEGQKAIKKLKYLNKTLISEAKEKDKKLATIENEYKNEIKSLEKKLSLNENNLINNELQLERYLKVLNNSMMIVETDFNRQILRTNKKFIKTVNMSYLDVSGKTIDKFLEQKRVNSAEYIEAWRNLKNGKSATLVNEYYFKGKKMIFRDTYTPFKNNTNKYNKVIIASIDISNEKF